MAYLHTDGSLYLCLFSLFQIHEFTITYFSRCLHKGSVWDVTSLVVSYGEFMCGKSKKISNKHNAELQRTNPGTKDMGKFSTFPDDAQNGFLLFLLF